MSQLPAEQSDPWDIRHAPGQEDVYGEMDYPSERADDIDVDPEPETAWDEERGEPV